MKNADLCGLAGVFNVAHEIVAKMKRLGAFGMMQEAAPKDEKEDEGGSSEDEEKMLKEYYAKSKKRGDWRPKQGGHAHWPPSSDPGPLPLFSSPRHRGMDAIRDNIQAGWSRADLIVVSFSNFFFVMISGNAWLSASSTRGVVAPSMVDVCSAVLHVNFFVILLV